MHRTIELTVPPATTDRLTRELAQIEPVVGLSVQRGASIKPPGDILIVHVLNRGADAVLTCADAARAYGAVAVVTAETASIIDPARNEVVEHDVDEAIWEEMETGLRHQARVTPNFLALMALGGAIAAAGCVAEGAAQAVIFVAASVIAPGFEPVARIPLGLVLRNWSVVRRGVVSTLAGYSILLLSAALAFVLLELTGTASAELLRGNAEVEKIAHPTTADVLVSLCGAAAGMVMIAAYRRSVIAGPLIAMVLIPAAGLSGAGIGAGQLDLLLQGLQRLGIDMVCIVGLGALIVLIKQLTVHRRAPMV